MFLLIHPSISWVQFLPHFSVSFLKLCCKLASHNFLKHLVCCDHVSFIGTLCTISDSIVLYRHITMGGHIIPELEKSNMMLWTLLQGLCQLLTCFCPHCKLRRFRSWEILQTWLSTLKIPFESGRMSNSFSFSKTSWIYWSL
jgi:hypothetical protein